MVKKGRKQKGGIALAPIIAGVATAHNLAKTVKPATKLTGLLNSVGLETDPQKLSGVRKAGAYVLQGMRDILGWGVGQSGNVLYGQSGMGNMIQGEEYGVPSLMRSHPQFTNQVAGLGKMKGGRKMKGIKV
jgi:hypothetical protein